MCVQARVDCNDLCRAASGHFGLQADRPQQLADGCPTSFCDSFNSAYGAVKGCLLPQSIERRP
jgi:hypothetical protein